MRRPEYQIGGLGVLFDDSGKGLDHVLDPFVPVEKAEREENPPAFDAKLVLVVVGVDERHVVDAVRDENDFLLVHSVDFLEEIDRPLTHHDEFRRMGRDLDEHSLLDGVGLLHHGVTRDDERPGKVANEREEIRPPLAAEDPVFVLKADNVDTAEIEEVGRPRVVHRVILPHLEFHPVWISVAFGSVVHCRHDDGLVLARLPGHGFCKVVRKSGDAAHAGNIVTHKSDSP